MYALPVNHQQSCAHTAGERLIQLCCQAFFDSADKFQAAYVQNVGVR